MSDLTSFRDHCARMATTTSHLPGCRDAKPKPPVWALSTDQMSLRLVAAPEPATCTGCVPAADQALFARLAAEADAYLARDPEVVLFAMATDEDVPLALTTDRAKQAAETNEEE